MAIAPPSPHRSRACWITDSLEDYVDSHKAWRVGMVKGSLSICAVVFGTKRGGNDVDFITPEETKDLHGKLSSNPSINNKKVCRLIKIAVSSYSFNSTNCNRLPRNRLPHTADAALVSPHAGIHQLVDA